MRNGPSKFDCWAWWNTTFCDGCGRVCFPSSHSRCLRPMTASPSEKPFGRCGTAMTARCLRFCCVSSSPAVAAAGVGPLAPPAAAAGAQLTRLPPSVRPLWPLWFRCVLRASRLAHSVRVHTGLLTACKVNRQSESRPAGSHHTNSGIMIRLPVNNHSLSQHETHS